MAAEGLEPERFSGTSLNSIIGSPNGIPSIHYEMPS
jgi:hypothetical protein